jgi:hypothetical protein
VGWSGRWRAVGRRDDPPWVAPCTRSDSGRRSEPDSWGLRLAKPGFAGGSGTSGDWAKAAAPRPRLGTGKRTFTSRPTRSQRGSGILR